MKDDVTRLTEEIKKRDGELSRMQQEVGLMQKNFKEDLATQSRFNAANSNSIMHLKGILWYFFAKLFCLMFENSWCLLRVVFFKKCDINIYVGN